MEFRDACKDDKIWAAGEEYPDSITGWVEDEEEELSFCDLVTEPADLKSCGLHGKSSVQEEDFRFDLDLGGCKSTEFDICPADNLFHQGRLLPLSVSRCESESIAHFSYGKSNIHHEKRRLLNEKMQAWKKDSGFSSTNSQFLQKEAVYSVSDKKLKRGNFATSSSNSTSRTNPSSKPPTSVSKTCFKWQQFFTVGLMKTPPLKVEDMRPKQRKPNNNGLNNSFLKRAVSCNYEGSVMIEQNKRRALNFQQKSQSVRENFGVKKTRAHSGWWMVGPLKSFNACRFSSNSVIDCLSGVGTTPSNMLSIEGDQNSMSLARVPSN